MGFELKWVLYKDFPLTLTYLPTDLKAAGAVGSALSYVLGGAWAAAVLVGRKTWVFR